VAFSPGGEQLAWATAPHGEPRPPPAIGILRAPFTGEPLPLEPAAYVETLAWSADGAWIAAGPGLAGEVTLWNATARAPHRSLPLQPGGASVGVAFRPGDAMLAASGDHIVLYRPADGASLAVYDIPVKDRLVRLVHTDRGLYDGDKEALRFLRLRIGDGAEAAIVSSGPAFDAFRRPGLLQAFLGGQ
jgi:hypothetical protein